MYIKDLTDKTTANTIKKASIKLGVFTAAVTIGMLAAQPIKTQAAENRDSRPTYESVKEAANVYGDNVSQDVIDAIKNVKDENGDRLYSDEFVDGLMANIAGEGLTGQVQFTFSTMHQYGFSLPSGGDKIKTREDINYLLNWTTSDAETIDGLDKKGSCGVSQIQWSYERRIEWLKMLTEIIGDRDYVTEEDTIFADTKMFLKELDPSGQYWTNLTSRLPEKPTSADWAEAICRSYVKPAYMEDRVKERRERAEMYQANREAADIENTFWNGMEIE